MWHIHHYGDCFSLLMTNFPLDYRKKNIFFASCQLVSFRSVRLFYSMELEMWPCSLFTHSFLAFVQFLYSFCFVQILCFFLSIHHFRFVLIVKIGICSVTNWSVFLSVSWEIPQKKFFFENIHYNRKRILNMFSGILRRSRMVKMTITHIKEN